MASTKRELAELEVMTGKLKRQFESHIFCLDQKASNKLEILQEWHEYVRRRAELEGEYNRKLDSCSERFLERVTRLRSATSAKGVAPTPSSTTGDLLYGMLAEAKALSARRTQYADQLNNEVLSRIDTLIRDTTFISRKVKDIGTGMHEEMMKSHRELTEAARSYHSEHSSMSDCHTKLIKLQTRNTKGKKGAQSEKDKKKEMKLMTSMMAHKREVIKARNLYLLTLKGSNVHTQRYFSKSLFELFEYADYDFQWSVGKIYALQADAELGLSTVQREATDTSLKLCQNLDTKQDLHRFMQDFGNYFFPPPEFTFIPAKKDEPTRLSVIDGIYEEMNKEREQLFAKLNSLHVTVDEEGKTLECVEKNVSHVQALVYDNGRPKMPIGTLSAADVSANLENEEETPPPAPSEVPRRTSTQPGHARNTSIGNVKSGVMNERREHMDFLYSVLQRISTCKTSIDKWDSQHSMMDNTLANLTFQDVMKLTQIEVQHTIGVARGARSLPKLFGGDIDEFHRATEQAIPLVVRSCCDHIMEQGKTTEGVFRVPGPANEIDELRQKFEKGEDPLIDNTTVDVHAVASLLKQYFRDLKESVFPPSQYHALTAIHSAAGDEHRKMIEAVHRVVHSLPANRLPLLQYLFKFLEDFSVFSEHTKMTASNIALVFGPTLIGSPPMDPQIMAQGMPLVNRACLFMLDNRVEVFGEPAGVTSADTYQQPGPDSYKIEYPEDAGADEKDAESVPPIAVVVEDAADESELYNDIGDDDASILYRNIAGTATIDESESDGEEEPPQRLVHALHDYDARNEKELSFKRGDVIEVFALTPDNNWWDGFIDEKRGYIPASYVKELPASSISASGHLESPMDTSQTSQTFSVDSLNYERNLSTSSSNAPQASPGTNLLSLPEEGEAANLVPSSAPQSKADHLGAEMSDELRRRSTGEPSLQQTPTEPPPQGVSSFLPGPGPGSSASLDRLKGSLFSQASAQQGAGGKVPPPVRARPGKLKQSNFEQLQNVIGQGGLPAGGPKPKFSAEGPAADDGSSRPAPIPGQRRAPRH